MRLRDDLTRTALVQASSMPWSPSPAPGVERRMLFRRGGERAQATSIVRYAPNSAFPSHVHHGGEEFLVLAGVFVDEHGDYPAGSYVRNPPGSTHAPASVEGATLFVRLWQFRRGDAQRLVRLPGEGAIGVLRPGVSRSRVLYADTHEDIRIETWGAGTQLSVGDPEGLELLVLAGEVSLGARRLSTPDWLRVPAGTTLELAVGELGAQVWVRRAPLLHADVCPFAFERPKES